MDLSRRNFLKCSLLAGAGAAGAGALRAIPGANSPSNTESSPSTTGPTTPALTPDGKVVHVCCPPGSPATQHAMPPAADPTGRQGVPGRKWVMVIDLSKCDGCGKCTEACGKMHFIPPDRQWLPVLIMRDAKLAAPYYFPRPCFHCDVPPCTKVCPVNATYKTQDGTVLIDNDRCIGCRFCIAACPYGARVFNWGPPPDPLQAKERGYSPEWGYPRKIGTVEKCDFCPDHAAAGMLPACVTGCPMGVIYYGDENEDAVTNSFGETLRLKKLLRDRSGYRHLEELGTEPRVYYLPPVNRQYPAPDEAKKEETKKS